MVWLYPLTHSVLTDARRSPGVDIQPPISQQLHCWGTRPLAVGLGWRFWNSLHMPAWSSCWQKIQPSHIHCHELWLLFCFHREKPSPTQIFPIVHEYCPNTSGLGWPLQATQLVRGFPFAEGEKYQLAISNDKNSFLLLWCRLGRGGIHFFLPRLRGEFAKCEWLSRRGVSRVCPSRSQAC